MPNCKVNVDANSNPLAHGIYQDLSKLGVFCEEMDQGYNVTNYADKYCADKVARNCIQSKGDGVVGPEEVLEYALNNHEKYRQVIEGRLGSPLPWALDDLDPKTPYDAEIRGKVNAAISELKKIITSRGIKEGSLEYNEKLAAGLTWFVAMPPVVQLTGNGFQILHGRMEKDSLGIFLEYLKRNGGLRVDGDYSEEYTALEAIRHQQGECTEKSKILFAALKMAGLAPVFVYEDLVKEEGQDPNVQDTISKIPMGLFHMCIGLDMVGRWRFFDPTFITSDAIYHHYTPLSPRQYLSMDYSNRGVSWALKDEWDKAITEHTRAIEIDPQDATAYVNRAYAWEKKGALDKAIADCTRAIEIDPNNLGAYINRGNTWEEKGLLDKSIADYTHAIEIDPKDAKSYSHRGIRRVIVHDFTGATRDLAEYIQRTGWGFDPMAKSLAMELGAFWGKSGVKPLAAQFQTDTSCSIAEAEARLILCYAFWQNGAMEDAAEKFGDLMDDLAPTQKPSPSTTAFLGELLDAMPKDMRKDARIKNAIKSLNKYQPMR